MNGSAKSSVSSNRRYKAELQLEAQYFTIKVKKQNYLGKPAIAIYINDAT